MITKEYDIARVAFYFGNCFVYVTIVNMILSDTEED